MSPSIHHPSSINDLLKQSEQLIGASKELIERSRALRTHSQQQTKRCVEAVRRSDAMSMEAMAIVRVSCRFAQKIAVLK